MAMVLGVIVDTPIISTIATCKAPYMLFKGWNRLLHDLIGREGPFLETICVPFAGLAIILWPLAVAGAVLASVLASFFLGAYAGLITYQVNLHTSFKYLSIETIVTNLLYHVMLCMLMLALINLHILKFELEITN